jgi:hypothetical protein
VSEVEPTAERQSLTRLEIGMIVVLVSMGIAGLVGLIAVLDADSDIAAVGIGFGVTVLVFQTGGTVACGLACLARRRLEALSLASLVAAGLAIDLFALAIWLEIDNEAYTKLTGIAFVWAVFGLVILGLSLAAQPRDALARWLYLAAVGAALLAGTLATALVLDAGSGEIVSTAAPVPVGQFANESLLRPLAAVFVVLGTLWFAALAASRVEKRPQT